jgi:hypothetical protein
MANFANLKNFQLNRHIVYLNRHVVYLNRQCDYLNRQHVYLNRQLEKPFLLPSIGYLVHKWHSHARIS